MVMVDYTFWYYQHGFCYVVNIFFVNVGHAFIHHHPKRDGPSIWF